MSDPLPGMTINVAVVDADRVVLVQREDFDVWCLLGGEIESGESLAGAAVRVAREALGVEAEPTRLVGLYSRPLFRGYHTAVVFAARVVFGDPDPHPDEFVAAEWFSLASLPPDILWGHRERIVDVLRGVGGSAVRMTDAIRPDDIPWSPRRLYADRDASGLPRAEFYRDLARRLGRDTSVSELPRS